MIVSRWVTIMIVPKHRIACHEPFFLEEPAREDEKEQARDAQTRAQYQKHDPPGSSIAEPILPTDEEAEAIEKR